MITKILMGGKKNNLRKRQKSRIGKKQKNAKKKKIFMMREKWKIDVSKQTEEKQRHEESK